MSFEVEIKYRAVDHAALGDRLQAIGAVVGPVVDQEDAYLAHPSRDFGQTHEALRLRREGPANLVTYKGPRLAGPTKTREEIELRLGDGPQTIEDLRRLFKALGFRPVMVVRKARRPFRLEQDGRTLTVTLDDAEGLGAFAEVETIADGPDDLPGAQAAVARLARALGLTDDQIEPRSYLRMTLERAREIGSP